VTITIASSTFDGGIPYWELDLEVIDLWRVEKMKGILYLQTAFLFMYSWINIILIIDCIQIIKYLVLMFGIGVLVFNS